MLLSKFEPVLQWTKHCDNLLYQGLVEILIPDVLRPIPSECTAATPSTPCATLTPQSCLAPTATHRCLDPSNPELCQEPGELAHPRHGEHPRGDAEGEGEGVRGQPGFSPAPSSGLWSLITADLSTSVQKRQ